jgi:uroporphyrinogen-III decarboxylase
MKMARETMTSQERLWAAIRLEKPDRVPIAPLISTPAAATLLGLDPAEVYANGEAQLDAEIKAFDEFGGWDGVIPTPVTADFMRLGFKVRIPGEAEGVSELQTLEMENWKIEDYDIIAEIGWNRFLYEQLALQINDMKPEEVTRVLNDYFALTAKGLAAVKERGAAPIFPIWNEMPFFLFSLTRSMVKFTEDLYYRPEQVERALKVAVPEWIKTSIDICKATGVMIACCIEERAGAFFYPLKVFERFWWPYTKQIVDALWSEGIVAWFHLDTCWDKNIPYFKQLPRGSAIIDLDGTTDIFAAKEVLRNHLCIASDVHPALLSLGKPEEVEAYCKKVIDEVGRDGGLILSTGCTVPGAVKPENFRAMIETGKTYEFSKK